MATAKTGFTLKSGKWQEKRFPKDMLGRKKEEIFAFKK